MSSAFDRLKEEFLSETEETLAALRADLGLLGASNARGAVDPAALDRVFRTAHSLKGVLGMFGLEAMGRVAHAMEGVLDEVRAERLPADARTMEALVDGCEALHDLLRRATDPNPADPRLVNTLVQRLDARREEATPEPPDPNDPLAHALAGLPESTIATLREAHSAGHTVALVSPRIDSGNFAARCVAVLRAMRTWGVIHATVEAPSHEGDGSSAIRFLASGREGLFALARAVGSAGGDVVPGNADRIFGVRREPTVFDAIATASKESAGTLTVTEPPSPTLRVRIERVDRLLQAHAGILHAKTGLDEAAAEVFEYPSDRMRRTALLQSLRMLDRRVRDLQEEVLEVRLVSIGSLLPKLERVVSSAARESGKQARFVARGSEVEVDKEIVDGLLSPLVHLLRNSVDHGVEGESVRRERGKPPEGTITMTARSEGTVAVLEVRDDGGGVDLDRVLEKARSKGLLPRTRTPSRSEILDTLFAPGFSTRDVATGLSGRGVGLDAVRDGVTSLGGSLEIETGDTGTTVRVRVPTTRAILSALLVRAGDETFVLPLTPIRQVVKIRPGDVEQGESGEAIVLEGERVAVEDLGTLVGRAPVDRRKDRVIGLLLVGIGPRTLLLVDAVGARRDVVTQGLGVVHQRASAVVGSTDLGDGRTLLLLDPAALLEGNGPRRSAAEANR